MQPTKQAVESLRDIYQRLWKSCEMMSLLLNISAHDGDKQEFKEGHEHIIKDVHKTLNGVFESLDVITKTLGVGSTLFNVEQGNPQTGTKESFQETDQFQSIFSKFQSLSEEGKNAIEAALNACLLREARGYVVKDMSSVLDRMEYLDDRLTECHTALEQLKALGDLLSMSTENGTPPLYDETISGIGNLIVTVAGAPLKEAQA